LISFIRKVHYYLLQLLAAVFTKSMEEGIVPADWRDANVTPIFKKGAKSSPSNYRPVSLTSVSCRVMESLIRDAITSHLTANKLIKKSQHGFVKDRSCVTNLLEFLEQATTVVDGGAGFDIIYLDFAKAFDKVPIYCTVPTYLLTLPTPTLLTWVYLCSNPRRPLWSHGEDVWMVCRPFRLSFRRPDVKRGLLLAWYACIGA